MLTRILAGIIVCFIGFNAIALKFFSLEAFVKASIASVFVGSIVGYFSYKEKKRIEGKENKVIEEKPVKKKLKRKSSK